jgi:hypothetical protein
MIAHEWPSSIDDLVEKVRHSPEETWWAGAARMVEDGLPEDVVKYLAVVGLAELASWSYKIDRDRSEPCAGRVLAFGRYFPDKDPTDHTDD